MEKEWKKDFELTCTYFLDFFLCKQCNELLPLKVAYDGIHIYFCILILKLLIILIVAENP